MAQPGPTLEESIEIAATPEKVWSIIADPAAMDHLSPHIAKTIVRGDLGVGATLINLNKSSWKRWPTTGKIVEYAAPTRYAHRISANGAVWSFTLEPTATGTKLVQRRELPQGLPAPVKAAQTAGFGSPARLDVELRSGMAETLASIKAAAEA